MTVAARSFETVHAQPGPRPLWVGLMGPSGGGKTYSALRLAKGIQSVTGGKIHLIDTESGRGLHYADLFDYEYTPFPPPHGSLDYIAAIKHAIDEQGARILIIDSFSHEHEGEGGMVEWHDAELDRMAGDDYRKREVMTFAAWIKPKAARKKLLRTMLRYRDVVFILCFRADEQSKPVKSEGKTKVVQMGFMPIAGKPFVYEATVCALLMPAANGVPTWNPENVGERLMKKLPEQFKMLFADGEPISEKHGKALAEWHKGGTAKAPAPSQQQRPTKTVAERVATFVSMLKTKDSADDIEAFWMSAPAEKLKADADPETLERMTLEYEGRLTEVAGGAE